MSRSSLAPCLAPHLCCSFRWRASPCWQWLAAWCCWLSHASEPIVSTWLSSSASRAHKMTFSSILFFFFVFIWLFLVKKKSNWNIFIKTVNCSRSTYRFPRTSWSDFQICSRLTSTDGWVRLRPSSSGRTFTTRQWLVLPTLSLLLYFFNLKNMYFLI